VGKTRKKQAKRKLRRKSERMRLTKERNEQCNGKGGGRPIMMGFKERTFGPLVAVSLEELVPQDHFYRHVQRVLDLSFVYDLVRECYSKAGRPSIDPVVFWHRCNS
jgi:transposase